MRRSWAISGTLALASAVRAQSPDAYFQVGFDGFADTFIIRLTDAARIQTARNILSGVETQQRHVSGIIAKAPAFYNSGWSYHFDPNSITFFSFAVEVCDGAPRYVEEHLAEAGGAFLPGNRWCPWGSKLLAEVPRPPAADRSVTVVSAASFGEMAIAPGSIATAFGTDLGPATPETAAPPLPIRIAGVSVLVRDRSGVEQNAELFAVAKGQVNFLAPANAASGAAEITVITADGRRFTGASPIERVAPAVFFSGAGPDNWIAANLTRIHADGSRETRPIIQGGPVEFGPEGDRLYLEIYGTGWRNAAGQVTVSARESLPVLYAGPQGSWPGLDQINVELPRSLSGVGRVTVMIRVETQLGFVESNPVAIRIAQ